MPAYLPYPKEADTKSRKARKGSRTKIFLTNKDAAKKIRKARKAEREAREAAEYEEVTTEE